MSNYLDWQSKVSSDREIVPLFYVADYRISPVDKIPKEYEDSVKLCNYTDVYKNTYITSDIEFMDGSASDNEIERFLIKDGDVLITKDSESWNDIGIPAIVKGDFENITLCGYHLALMRPNENLVIPKYLFYCFESKQHRLQLEIEATGVTRFGIPKNAIAKYKIPLPSLTQQNKVVDYLDKAVAKIDALIEKKVELVSILEEKKNAVINQAVTRGLDPSVSLIDSGVEWLGEIPEQWEVVKLKYLTNKIGDGLHATPEYTADGEFYFINGVNLKNGKIEYTSKTNTVSFEEFLKYKIDFSDKTLFLSLNGTIGNIALYNDEKIILGKSAAFIDLANDKLCDKTFLYYFFQSDFVNKYFEMSLSGTTIKNLSLFTLRNTPILLPFIAIQLDIVNYINKKLGRLDYLTDKIFTSIELLKEKRIAIISAAINGELNSVLS
ncbi:MAG: hsdS [Segetibacter sp.]|nr:hsdS [Segetibacter sp.]